ncbi:hypothetical protein [Lacibacter sp.]|uniref:hypothetical protein n=1 Tax=Lacibacter sp. TaxID=1915409 RepID=UPI002B4B31C9|nr:hypothetical protein [Lacibacter sp.]HLP37035.1 hypothetical protein [Lacibacter sp.]
MKHLCLLALLSLSLFSCQKQDNEKHASADECSKSAGYAPVETKISVSQGVYGTVHFTQGNCMPAGSSVLTDCRTCPVKRKVRIYNYSLISDAVRSSNSSVFFESLNTTLIAETESDANGFFQVTLQPGTYTMVVVENGKLYANSGDGQGGINPFTVGSGIKNVDMRITYKAVY